MSKEEAIAFDKKESSKGAMIYTDGSGYKGQIGALAIVFTNGKKTSALRYRLGPIREYTVFEGELVAIILGFHLARSINGTHTRINLSIRPQYKPWAETTLNRPST